MPGNQTMIPLCAIPEVPSGYTRVLAPIPGTKCAEHNYIIVRKTGELSQENAVSMCVNNNQNEECRKEEPLFIPPPVPRKKSSRRIGMREKILPFELHGRIIKYAQDHRSSWTIALMREYHQKPELFLLTRKSTRDCNFFHDTVGDCASSLAYFIEPIVEECIAENMESLFFDESNCPSASHNSVEPAVDKWHKRTCLCSWLWTTTYKRRLYVAP
jgi:hypothetical protein